MAKTNIASAGLAAYNTKYCVLQKGKTNIANAALAAYNTKYCVLQGREE